MKIFVLTHVFLIDFVYFALPPAEKNSKLKYLHIRLFIIIYDWENLLSSIASIDYRSLLSIDRTSYR